MKRFNVTVNGVAYDVVVEEVTGDNAATAPAPVAAPAPAAAPAPKKTVAPAGGTPVKAPLQGTVMKVNVKPGDTVKKGAAVVVIEALKMENEVPAPMDGVVAAVNVKNGDSVKTDEILLTIN